MKRYTPAIRAIVIVLLSSTAPAQEPRAASPGPPTPPTSAPSSDGWDWLMPINGAKALEWSRRQTEQTRQKIKASPTFRAVVRDIEAAHRGSAALPDHYRVGSRYLRLTKNQAHPYGVLEYADAKAEGEPGTWKTAFDLDAYNKTAAKPYTIKWLEEWLARQEDEPA